MLPWPRLESVSETSRPDGCRLRICPTNYSAIVAAAPPGHVGLARMLLMAAASTGAARARTLPGLAGAEAEPRQARRRQGRRALAPNAAASPWPGL